MRLLKISSGLERLNLHRSSLRLNRYVCNPQFPVSTRARGKLSSNIGWIRGVFQRSKQGTAIPQAQPLHTDAGSAHSLQKDAPVSTALKESGVETQTAPLRHQ